MKIDRVRQFKLVTGDEIVCEVIEWDDDENIELVVQKIYKIETFDNPAEQTRYYALKPYMSFQLEDGMYQTINSAHVCVSALPSHWMIDQYKTLRSQEEEKPGDVEELIEKRLERVKQMLGQLAVEDDSDGTNVVRLFENKNKLH